MILCPPGIVQAEHNRGVGPQCLGDDLCPVSRWNELLNTCFLRLMVIKWQWDDNIRKRKEKRLYPYLVELKEIHKHSISPKKMSWAQ